MDIVVLIACVECGAVLKEIPKHKKDHFRTLLSLKPIKCHECGCERNKFFESDSSESGILSFTVKLPDKAEVLLQTVIEPLGKTSEGTLIKCVVQPWFDILDLIKQDPSIVFEITPEKWEEIIAGAYKSAGFDKVTLTPRSGDFGRDVIAEKKGIGTVRVIDQVKRFKPGLLVKADDVRALLGVLQSDPASKGFITTTSDFAPNLMKDPLITPHVPSKIELINGKELLKRLNQIKKDQNK
ncbi:MAG: restriction endonuclease [Candidatus Paceibacterota bacterium]